ncbi:hypothetical protein BX600DRAFT_386442 [Xylariales sp. PMI_506]|nr:hypothetical protein BX600DRAFT_386442 [Xylariales sp. PMI_506]
MDVRKTITIAFWLLFQLCAVLGLANIPTPCTHPSVRLEWQALADEAKASYLASVNCLATKQSRIGLSHSTLYDDFSYVHATMNVQIHYVASFLPWHRWFVHIYEDALRFECNYTGPMPYWDWTQDAGSLPSAAVFSPDERTGFGGNGNGSQTWPPASNPLTSCVTTGAVADLRPQYFYNLRRPHCLNRFFSNLTTNGTDRWGAVQYSAARVSNILSNSTTFQVFAATLEDGPHATVHIAINGDMFPVSSPNDPLFFLHHAQVDRLWWTWQQADPETRLLSYGGNKYEAPDTTPAELTDAMDFMGLSENMSVMRVMVTESVDLCYVYV